MEKIYFDNLVIEVTRRCNMQCAHCVRGKNQNTDIQMDVIKKLFEHTHSISTLTLTGGEPSLAIDKIDAIIDEINTREIPLYGIYCVTNGKADMEPLILRMLKLYAICVKNSGEPECSGLALSRDNFHEPISYENELLLRGLSFFREDKFTDFHKNGYLIPAGNARNIINNEYKTTDHRSYNTSHTPEIEITKDEIYIMSTIAITSNGDILQDCDYAYDETDEFKIGHVNNMKGFIEYLKQIANKMAS